MKNICQKCGGKSFLSKALQHTLVQTFNSEGKKEGFYRRIGKPEMTNCLKCEKCGHSYIPKSKPKTDDKGYINLIKTFADQNGRSKKKPIPKEIIDTFITMKKVVKEKHHEIKENAELYFDISKGQIPLLIDYLTTVKIFQNEKI